LVKYKPDRTETDVKTTLSIKDFFEKLIFCMEGSFEYKISIILEMMCVFEGTKRIPFQEVAALANRFFIRFHKQYEKAKKIAHKMGFNTERFISYSHFYKEVAANPKHMDFLIRFSIGPYNRELIDQEIVNQIEKNNKELDLAREREIQKNQRNSDQKKITNY
jgi:hypothetical protein